DLAETARHLCRPAAVRPPPRTRCAGELDDGRPGAARHLERGDGALAAGADGPGAAGQHRAAADGVSGAAGGARVGRRAVPPLGDRGAQRDVRLVGGLAARNGARGPGAAARPLAGGAAAGVEPRDRRRGHRGGGGHPRAGRHGGGAALAGHRARQVRPCRGRAGDLPSHRELAEVGAAADAGAAGAGRGPGRFQLAPAACPAAGSAQRAGTAPGAVGRRGRGDQRLDGRMGHPARSRRAGHPSARAGRDLRRLRAPPPAGGARPGAGDPRGRAARIHRRRPGNEHRRYDSRACPAQRIRGALRALRLVGCRIGRNGQRNGCAGDDGGRADPAGRVSQSEAHHHRGPVGRRGAGAERVARVRGGQSGPYPGPAGAAEPGHGHGAHRPHLAAGFYRGRAVLPPLAFARAVDAGRQRSAGRAGAAERRIQRPLVLRVPRRAGVLASFHLVGLRHLHLAHQPRHLRQDRVFRPAPERGAAGHAGLPGRGRRAHSPDAPHRVSAQRGGAAGQLAGVPFRAALAEL
ncbi:MAG: hypothetical protein AVDCRST_MAG89-2697, partial [uncultured Gemmatimonadetes bacterium]